MGGRSPAKAGAAAERIGERAQATTPREAVAGRDAVLLAVLWSGVEEMLESAGAGAGSLAGTALIDPSNAVEHGVGVLLTGPGRSAAQRIAELAPGAHVVKAFHLFSANQWLDPATGSRAPVTVAICGDDQAALQTVSGLVRDVGAIPAVLGALERARQVEEAAGFVIGLAFAGVDPQTAVPGVPADPAGG
jgi:8-hydroxy-5-deazaflavin:NADPH oxidoreductase